MATQLKMHNKGEEDDDEDLEALRLAALKTLRPKPAPFCPPPVSTVVYHTHRNRVSQAYQNPNLITIVPVGADPDPVFKPPPRVVTNPMVRFNTNVKVLNRVNTSQNNTYLKSNVPTVDPKAKSQEEEVSTKFSRFEDTESESEEEESVTEDKGSESSEESDADCIALQDDDSLEALMAQMEQEFGEESETKAEKKKNKSSSKTKNKSNTKGEDKKNEKVEQKTATDKMSQVKPNRETHKARSLTKSVPPVKIEVKPMTRSPVKSVSPVRVSSPSFKISRVSPLRQRSPIKITSKTNSPVRPKSPYRNKSPVRQRSPIRLKSPVKSPKHSPLRSKSPHSRSKSPIHSSRLKSPVRQKTLRSPPRQNSLIRSPVKQKSPLRLSPVRRSRSPLRPYSPVGKYSIHRKSPIRRSPPSPYSRVRRSRSPLRKRSPSPFARSDRGFLPRSKDRSPKYSPNYYSKSPSPGRDRRSRTPPKKWCPISPRRRSPLSPTIRYRSPNQIRRSISPRRVYSRSPTPPYYSPRRRSPSPFKKKIAPRRRSVSPSPTPRRSISPRRRSVSPKRREFSPLRRPLSPKGDVASKRVTVSPRRKPISPKFKKYSPVRSPVRRQRSMSPQRRVSPLRRKMNSPPRQKRDRGWNKNDRPKSDTDTKANNWSRSSSVSLSPSPQPRDRETDQSEELPRRHKSPLRIQKGSGDNSYYNKSEKRPISPDSRNGSGDVVDRRRGGRNWDRSGQSWDGKRSDRDRRRDRTIGSRSRKEASAKNEKENSNNKSDVPTFPQKTNDPVLEARRKKFESNDLVEPASKKIRLRNSPVKEKTIENVEVQTEPEEVVSKPEPEDDFNLDLDIEDDILDLGGEMWSSDEGEPIVKHNGNPSRKVVRAPSPKKKKSVKERITLEEKVDKPKRKSSTTTSTSTEVRPVNMKDTASSPLAVAQKEEDVDKVEEKSDKDESPADRGTKDEMDSDLRAELSRRRAERLTKAGSVHKNLPARIVQSAFEGVMGKKKVKKEKKEKESKSKEKVKKSPPSVQDVPKEKTDGRRVLVLKRTAPVRLPSQTAINVTFSEDNEDDSSGSESDEKYVSPLKRKLPIHYRLGLPEEKRRPHKVRKVKLKHSRHQVGFDPLHVIFVLYLIQMFYFVISRHRQCRVTLTLQIKYSLLI